MCIDRTLEIILSPPFPLLWEPVVPSLDSTALENLRVHVTCQSFTCQVVDAGDPGPTQAQMGNQHPHLFKPHSFLYHFKADLFPQS